MSVADEWLANLANNTADGSPHDPGTVGSIPTSTATNTRTAQGNIYKSCRCPEHQEIYSNWPTRDAELRIAHCMGVCMYCGKDFLVAAELRIHLKRRKEYWDMNLTVQLEGRRHNALTPAWIHKPQAESSHHATTRAARTRSPRHGPEETRLPC